MQSGRTGADAARYANGNAEITRLQQQAQLGCTGPAVKVSKLPEIQCL